MFIKKKIPRATTATSIAKGLMQEEKLGLFFMPPRKTRTSMRKLQVRNLVQEFLSRQSYSAKEWTAIGNKKLKNWLHNYHFAEMLLTASKP